MNRRAFFTGIAAAAAAPALRVPLVSQPEYVRIVAPLCIYSHRRRVTMVRMTVTPSR